MENKNLMETIENRYYTITDIKRDLKHYYPNLDLKVKLEYSASYKIYIVLLNGEEIDRFRIVRFNNAYTSNLWALEMEEYKEIIQTIETAINVCGQKHKNKEFKIGAEMNIEEIKAAYKAQNSNVIVAEDKDSTKYIKWYVVALEGITITKFTLFSVDNWTINKARLEEGMELAKLLTNAESWKKFQEIKANQKRYKYQELAPGQWVAIEL